MKKIIYIPLIVFGLLISSCSTNVPESSTLLSEEISIYPDFKDVTIPFNIAPLNFKINGDGEKYITNIYSSKGEPITISGDKLDISLKKWKSLLEENKGDTLYIKIYAKKRDNWYRYPTIKNFIAPEPIDPYLSYRLIEPSYITYEEMTISQRDLTNFDSYVIYENSMISNMKDGQCINCHSFQNYNKTGNMQFHVRQYHGGTIIVQNGKPEKVNLKTDYTISAGVYPSWHPFKNLIAYSVNNTGQNFHTKDHQKVEVLDTESDLILYDVSKNEVRMIANTKNELETFPYWSPDGKTLYYASAHFQYESSNDKEAEQIEITDKYQEIKYNIYKKSFNPETFEFGKTDTVFMASDFNQSATFPRESPDGKYLLFTLGDYGNFHIWHKSSDLYLMNLATKDVRPLTELNSSDVESYHSWSSNGRWIVFSSRRDDGSYTRSYIAYFDKNGKAHKPFILPQKDPEFYIKLLKSFNIPEFMVEPVDVSRREFVNAIKKDAKKAHYSSENQHTEKEIQTEKDPANFYE